MKKYLQKLSYTLTAFMMLFTVSLMAYTSTVSALPITGRKVTIGSSVASASTTYTFDFTVPSSTVIKSFQAQACDTASGTCTQAGSASGFSGSSATVPSQPVNLGDASGWTVTTNATALKIAKSGNVAAPTGAQTVSFATVTNPSASNSTFFLRLTTYSDATWTTPIDTGVVAASTAGQITVTASVDETLTFTLASATVGLGTLTTGTTGSGTSTMTAATNGGTGYAITVNGTTLTSGANTIPALASQTASSQGTSQFGINLLANTTPSVGAAVSGAGSGTVNSNYNTTNQFRFVTGDTVASAASSTNSNTYTTSYIANISATQKAGAYSTALTYIATATF